ncbi:MAG: NAD(P)H-dependent oxidoreductase [Eisenbergiella sp.]
MKVSVILGHPYEGSFNAAIAKTVVEALRENGHQVMFHDLYQENFNPVIPKEELVSDQTKESGQPINRKLKHGLLLFTQTGGDSRRQY